MLSNQPSPFTERQKAHKTFKKETLFLFRTMIFEVLHLCLQLNGFLLEHIFSLVKVYVYIYWSQQAEQMPASFHKLLFFLAAFSRCQCKMRQVPISAFKVHKTWVVWNQEFLKKRGGGSFSNSKIALFAFPTVTLKRNVQQDFNTLERP